MVQVPHGYILVPNSMYNHSTTMYYKIKTKKSNKYTIRENNNNKKFTKTKDNTQYQFLTVLDSIFCNYPIPFKILNWWTPKFQLLLYRKSLG